MVLPYEVFPRDWLQLDFEQEAERRLTALTSWLFQTYITSRAKDPLGYESCFDKIIYMKREQPWRYNATTLWINYVDIIPHELMYVHRCADAVT